MVATAEEAKWFTGKCRAAGLPTAGTMVEVPAAALRSKHVMAECDFASIGTNDLSQYTFAADRMNGALAGLLTGWQPALWELIVATVEGAGGKPVGICGEAAADPLLAVVLVGLGATSLSMAPTALADVRASLLRFGLEDAQRIAEAALAADDAASARAAAQAAAENAA